MRWSAIWVPQPHIRSLALAPGRGGVHEQLALIAILRYAFTDLPVDQNLRAYQADLARWPRPAIVTERDWPSERERPCRVCVPKRVS